MSWFRKKIDAPSGETVQLDGLQVWMVRWVSRYGSFNTETQKEAQAFTNEEDANHFAQALRDAFALIRHTSQAHVYVEKQS